MRRNPDSDVRERRIQSILESTQDVVFTLDTRGRHTGVYGSWVARSGQTLENYLGKTAREILGPEAAAVHEAALARALKGEFVVYDWSVTVQGRTSHYQTSLSPIRTESGEIEGVVGIGRDITELIETQEELRKRERELLASAEYLRTILDTTIDGFWVVDLDKRISEANMAYCRMSGYTREELTRLRINDIDATEDPIETAERIERILRTGAERFETKHRRKDGSLFDVEISAARYDDPSGARFVCFCRDITERKRNQEELRRQLEDKILLLRETHHRIKNSFLSAESLLGLQASKAANPEAMDMLKGAQARIAAMRVLYQRILEADQYRRVSLRPYLESLGRSILSAYSTEPAISLEFDLEDLEADSEVAFPLGAMAAEILTNSFKHAFPAGNPGRIRMLLHRGPGGRGILRLEDDGRGISGDVRIDESKSFGLSLLRMMSEQIRGSFRIESAPGRGTSCEIEFPIPASLTLRL